MTIINWAAVIMVGMGAIFMLLSIIRALAMLPRVNTAYQRRWKILTFFKGFFLLGYIAFIVITVKDLPIPVEIITGAVFFGGALFVFIIITLSKGTISTMADQEEALAELNLQLEKKVKQRTSALQESMVELAAEAKQRQKATIKMARMGKDLRHIMDTISTGIRVMDMSSRVKQVNRRFCDLTGLSREELIGSNCYENFQGEDCRSSQNCQLQLTKKNPGIHSGEVSKTNKNGQTFRFLVTSAPLVNSKGQMIGLLEDFQDITPLVQAQQEKDKVQSQLMQAAKLESVGQLAAGIAHEINTPVQFIGTNIDFLDESFEDVSGFIDQVKEAVDTGKANKKLSEDLQEADWDFLAKEIPQAINQSREGVNRVRKLVQAMKEFSHPGTREMAPADINAIIENTATISQSEWQQAADLRLELGGDIPLVPCLTDEMGQVILNILVNAGQAIADQVGDSGKKGEIRVTTQAKDNMMEIKISDTGSGMSEEVKKKIFDPFFTTREVGSGTGQGLAIVHDIITNKHHGHITVESSPGQGTTFLIKLPLQSQD